jgi:hypothetical protein
MESFYKDWCINSDNLVKFYQRMAVLESNSRNVILLLLNNSSALWQGKWILKQAQSNFHLTLIIIILANNKLGLFVLQLNCNRLLKVSLSITLILVLCMLQVHEDYLDSFLEAIMEILMTCVIIMIPGIVLGIQSPLLVSKT